MSAKDPLNRGECRVRKSGLTRVTLGLALGLCLGGAGLVSEARASSVPRVSGHYAALQSVANDSNWGSKSIAPPTGRKQLRRGAAILALGLLRAATTVVHLVFSNPSRCGPQKQLDWSVRSCKNLRIYGLAGLGLSAAFVAGGGVELGRGLWLQRRHQQWKRTHWHQFSSWATQRGASGQAWHLGPSLW